MSENTEEPKLMWWGYLHQNGSIQLKRWLGDHKDYTTDCEGNEFVITVVKPFEAPDRITAFRQVLISVLEFPSPEEMTDTFEAGFEWLLSEAERADSYPGNKHARIMFLYVLFHREKFIEMIRLIRMQDELIKRLTPDELKTTPE